RGGSVGVGRGARMVKVTEVEVPPPGVGVNTLIWAVPEPAMSAAEMLAWSWVFLTKVVERLEPCHLTVEVAVKFAPVTVSVKAGPPATALLDDSEVIEGAGLPEAGPWS